MTLCLVCFVPVMNFQDKIERHGSNSEAHRSCGMLRTIIGQQKHRLQSEVETEPLFSLVKRQDSTMWEINRLDLTLSLQQHRRQVFLQAPQ